MRTVQYIPRATEKAYVEQTKNTYVFYVPMKASKQEIAKQISAAFKVTVIDVRTAVRKGKPTRFSRGKHAYPGITNRQDKKVAYITVKEGDKIPVFEEVKDAKEDKKEAKKAEKADKKAEKKAKEAEEKK
jgi:ribosomal protein L23